MVGGARYECDADGNVLFWHDAAGRRVERDFDLAGRIVAERLVDAAGKTSWGRVFEYDPRGLLRKVTGESGAVTEYLYDYEGQRTVKRVQAGGTSKDGALPRPLR